MVRRPGLSLTEVLVALFLMAIGVMGVLTMFPLGAVQMGQAVKDERCAECSAQADAYMRWYWRTYIVQGSGPGPNENKDPIWEALNGGTGNSTPPSNSDPSPPVFVDPMGNVAHGGGYTAGTAAAEVQGTTPKIARRNLKLIYDYHTQTPADDGSYRLFSLRTCTLLDGFTYGEDGLVQVNPATNQLERENRYNWLWVLQRPSNNDPYTVNMAVVVFDRRVHMYPASAPELALTLTGGVTDDQTGVTVTGYTDPALTPTNVPGKLPPGLQKGSWVADTSASTKAPSVCEFYRVVSATKDPAANQFFLEFQNPIRPPVGGGTRTGGGAFTYFGGAAEVFQRAPLKK